MACGCKPSSAAAPVMTAPILMTVPLPYDRTHAVIAIHTASSPGSDPAIPIEWLLTGIASFSQTSKSPVGAYAPQVLRDRRKECEHLPLHLCTALPLTPAKLAGRDSDQFPKCRRELALIAEAQALGNLEHRFIRVGEA